LKNELLAMELELVSFALENGVATLPTGENTVDFLKRIVVAMRGEEIHRRGRRKRDEAEQPVA
jgi:hypothetical protein